MDDATRLSSAGAKASHRGPRAVTLLVAGAFFMEMLDGTVITTALPQIGRSFGVSAVALGVGMTAYLLALAVFIPIGGWLADRVGARRVFAGALALFTLASVLCGLSRGLWSFTAARVLQGVVGAAMVPVGRLLVLRTTAKEQLVSAIGTIVWPVVVAPVLGPPLGGFLVLHASWPWIFFLNVPLGLLAIALTFALVPKDAVGGEARPLDLSGFLLTGGALVLVVGAVDLLGNRQQRAATAPALLGLGLVLGAAGVRHLRRHPTPLIDPSPLGIPTFAVVAWGGSLLRMSIGSLPFLLPLLFQVAFGFDALTAGALLLFVFAGNLAMKTFTTRVLRRFGFRRVMLVNGVLVAASIATCALLTRATPYWLVAAILFAGGAFRSMQFTSLATIQFADIPTERMADANTLAAIVQQLTLGLGVVFGAALLNVSAWLRGRPPGAPDFRAAFLVTAAVALLGLVDTLRLDRAAGSRLLGHAD